METVSKIQPVPFHIGHLDIDKQKAKGQYKYVKKCIRPRVNHNFYKTLHIRGEGTNREETFYFLTSLGCTRHPVEMFLYRSCTGKEDKFKLDWIGKVK